MELTDIQIEENKNEFLQLVNSITRPGVVMDKLISQLNNSDFFEAPASAKYHLACRGGLCQHSLNVYKCLKLLVSQMYPEGTFEEDSLKIVALFHDFDKMNKYEKTVMNKKVYSPTGSKYDEMGKFDWQSFPGYKIREEDVFVLGSHGENSVYMTETFIPLSTSEFCAILNHHSVYDNPQKNITGIYSKYPLACMLHLADMMSTYLLESNE